MTGPIPIQAPRIDPPIFQRMGGEEGLAPLIQALEFYKTSKQHEERINIERADQQSTGAVRDAQTAALRKNLADRDQADQAWRDTVNNAPQTLQPFLKAVDGLRGLDPALQQVVAPVLARQIPGFANHPDPQTLAGFGNLLRSGLPLGVAAKIYDVDLDGLGVPKSYQNWKYTPPGQAGQEESRRRLALSATFSQADKQIQQIQKAVKQQQDRIAQEVIAQRNGGKPPLPGVPITYDPSDPQMVTALHQFMAQKHYDVQLHTLTQDREAARQQIKDMALPGATGDAATDRVNQILQLMGQPADSSQ